MVLVLMTHWPTVPSLGLAAGRLPIDKAMHLVLYAVFGALVGMTNYFQPLSFRWLVTHLFFALTIFAAFDELSQPFFTRNCDLSDWIADIAGAAFGLLVSTAAIRLFRCRPSRRALTRT
ncbi:MAG: VanZ family protein [Verrucomicrobia bacterium]|nr:VanZ family protein [Verrucomicrobiota bacterium]